MISIFVRALLLVILPALRLILIVTTATMLVEIALSALATTALTTLLLLVLVVIVLLMAAFIVKANVLVVADVFSKSVPHILVLLVAAWSASVHTLTEVMEFSAVTALQA